MKKERKPIFSAQDARQVPMDSLLSRLGIKRAGNRYHCPFHDDKHPRAGIFVKRNLLHCFVCDKSWSTIDLVMHLQGCEVYEAITWIGEAFYLPLRDSRIRFINKGRTDFAMKRYVAGKDRPVLEQFIMAPAYADLSPASAKVGVWLLAHMEDNLITISQRDLQQTTGYSRRGTLTNATQELVDIGLLAIQTHGAGKTDYRATPLSTKFRTWADNNPKYLSTHRTSNVATNCIQLTDADYQSWTSMADGILKAFGSWSCFRRLEGKPEEKTLRLWIAEHGDEAAYEALRAYCRDNKAAFGRIGGKEEVIDFVHRRGAYLTTEDGGIVPNPLPTKPEAYDNKEVTIQPMLALNPPTGKALHIQPAFHTSSPIAPRPPATETKDLSPPATEQPEEPRFVPIYTIWREWLVLDYELQKTTGPFESEAAAQARADELEKAA